jgi:hypothetical protein
MGNTPRNTKEMEKAEATSMLENTFTIVFGKAFASFKDMGRVGVASKKLSRAFHNVCAQSLKYVHKEPLRFYPAV